MIPRCDVIRLAMMLALCFFVTTVLAQVGGVKVKGNWDIHNATGQTAYDFHMDVYSDSNLNFISSVNGAFGSFEHSSGQFNPLVKKYHWSNGEVPHCTKTHIGLELWQKEKNKIVIQQAFWTDADGNKIPPLGGFVRLPGFEVIPWGAPPGGSSRATLRMLNDMEDPMVIKNFSWSLMTTETALPDLRFQSGGLGNSVGDFNLRAQSFFDVFTELEVEPDEFLLFQGQVYDGDGNYYGDFIYEHQHGTIPEPTSLLLFATGLIPLGIRLRRRL